MSKEKKIYSQEDFSYAVSTITGFTDQSSSELLSKSLLGLATPTYANVRLGIKGTQAVQVMDASPIFQDGNCGWTATGTTSFTQVDLTACPEKVNTSFCPKDIYGTWMSMFLKPGMPEEEVPFEEQIAELYLKEVQKRVETKLWTATVAGGDCFDGFKTLLVSGATGVAISASPTAFSATEAYGVNGNPITEVDKLINALDSDALSREDLVVFMSHANFRLYVQALTRANFFQNYIGDSSITGNMIAIHPNTNIKIVPTVGLSGSGRVVIGPSEYFLVGFDLLSNHEKVDMWYSKDNREIRLAVDYSYGANIVKPAGASIKYFATNNIA